ncbi:MAG: cytochrome P460 family protein [Oligoflexus sp.]|jgi:hypothetical protein
MYQWSQRAVSSVLLGALMMSCGSKDDGAAMPSPAPEGSSMDMVTAGMFPVALLEEYRTWTPVLAGDQAFKSAGHGGIFVRTYLNGVAVDHVAASDSPYPMAVGSVLAKAVVDSASQSSESARRVYFMRKESPGFDAANNDWSYAVANRVNSKLVFDTRVRPTEPQCVSCHAKFAAYDYVQTVDFYKRQTTSP